MSIEAWYTWHCDRCGEKQGSFNKEHLEKVEASHICNPVLYDLVRGFRYEDSYSDKGKPRNNNGSTYVVADQLGITRELAGLILNEMEKRDLIRSAGFVRD